MTDRNWAVGLILVVLAVLAVAAGLLGLYPRLREQVPRLATGGAVCMLVAGFAALIALVAVAVVAIYGLAMDPPPPILFFRAVLPAFGPSCP